MVVVVAVMVAVVGWLWLWELAGGRAVWMQKCGLVKTLCCIALLRVRWTDFDIARNNKQSDWW